MGKKKITQELKQFTDEITKLMSKHESLTSHVLLAYLYLLHKIYPWHIIPQPTSKRGIIDFFYLPHDKDYNVFVEMKKFLSLSEDKILSTSKYLKIKFPQALKKLGRIDGKRLLLVTDLHTITVSVRQKERGKTSKGNYVIEIPGIPGKNCSDEVAKWLKMSCGEANRIVLWDDAKNRYELIHNLIKTKNTNLYKKTYDAWCLQLNVRGKGWPEKYLKAFCAKAGLSKKAVPPRHIEAVEEVFSKTKINSLVKKTFTDYGVIFRQGRTKYLFS